VAALDQQSGVTTMSSQPSAAADVSQMLQQAVQLHQRGQFDAARRLYRDVLRLAPDQPDALHLLGVLALQGGQPNEAVRRIQRAIEVRPGSAVYHGNLGVALQATGKLDAARANLERAVKLDPQQVDASFNLGVTLQTLGLSDEAVGRYRQVLTLVPGHLGARRNLGNALRELGRHEDAVDAYRLALVLAPTDAGLLGSMGASLVALERLDEGIAAFEKATQHTPDDPDAWLNLAMALHQAERRQQRRRCPTGDAPSEQRPHRHAQLLRVQGRDAATLGEGVQHHVYLPERGQMIGVGRAAEQRDPLGGDAERRQPIQQPLPARRDVRACALDDQPRARRRRGLRAHRRDS
jgi:tetratricopeptide (TPR) repeat protein